MTPFSLAKQLKHITPSGMQPCDTIGSHLCERLLAEGNDIICIDNYFTGHKSNIRHLLSHPNFEVIRHDIVYPYMAEIEEIYNLACPASPIYYQHDPIKTTQTSVIGSINMLGMAKYNRAKILQASTSEVYGDPLIHPQREDYWGHVNPLGIRSCYDEGKRCAESLFMSYREHGIPVKIIRIFNTYGPKMDINDGRVVSNFIVQALRGDNITIYGDGGQSRSFQYIDDLIEGMVRMMNDTPDDFTSPVNIGNPNEFTIAELAREVISLTGSKSKIVHLPLPADDPQQRQPDISLARNMLGGWEPKIQLRDGLLKTIAYFEEVLSRGGIRRCGSTGTCKNTATTYKEKAADHRGLPLFTFLRPQRQSRLTGPSFRPYGLRITAPASRAGNRRSCSSRRA